MNHAYAGRLDFWAYSIGIGDRRCHGAALCLTGDLGFLSIVLARSGSFMTKLTICSLGKYGWGWVERRWALPTEPIEILPTAVELAANGSHRLIIERLDAWGNSTTPGRTEARTVSRRLNQLKSLRKRADYFIGKDYPRCLSADSIKSAKTLLNNSAMPLRR
jgi:hypothetical protein